jgi:hypothetical protein
MTRRSKKALRRASRAVAMASGVLLAEFISDVATSRLLGAASSKGGGGKKKRKRKNR